MRNQTKFTFSFEKLNVYKTACEFTDKVYELTEQFPSSEKYDLVRQARRSASSVAANLAEGSMRISLKEQARFSEIAYGSLAETFHHILQAQRLNYLTETETDALRPLIFKTSNMINMLRKSQIKRHNSKEITDPHIRNVAKEEQTEYEYLKDLPI